MLCKSVIFTFLAMVLFNSLLSGQASKDTSDYINFEEAKFGTILTKDKISIFSGEVAFSHKGVHFYADTVYRSDNIIRAKGNILIQQGDSLSIFADSLFYNSVTRQCELYSNVSLIKNDQKLYTEKLSYNTNTKIAAFDNNGTFTNGATWVKSKSAIYDTKSDDIILQDNVYIQDPDFDIKTTRLKYNSRLRYVTFLAPSIVTQNNGTKLYSESGFYDIDKKYGEFIGNPQYKKGADKAIATRKMVYDGLKQFYYLLGDARYQDSLRYVSGESIKYFQKREYFEVDGGKGYAFLQDSAQLLKGKKIQYDKKNNLLKTIGRSRIEDGDNIIEADNNDFDNKIGKGISKGNVILHSKSNNSTLHAEEALIDKKGDYVKAYGKRAMFSIVSDQDTTYVSADTLWSFKKDTITGDTSRVIQAYHDVKILSKNFQGVCDSMYYSTIDSIFRLYRQPILWSDSTNQYFGDTILIFQKDNKISELLMQNKAMIITSPEEVYFSQIGGKEIRAFMSDGKLSSMTVNGNAQTVYYTLNDDKEYTGVNTLNCSHLRARLVDNELNNIKFYKKNDGKYYPMDKANHAQIQLAGFKWEIKKRPLLLTEMRSNSANVLMFSLSGDDPNAIPTDIKLNSIPVSGSDKDERIKRPVGKVRKKNGK